MIAVLAALGVRGASDWSNSFAVFWFGLWGVALVLAVVGIVEAAVRRSALARQRGLAVALSMVTFALSVLLAGWILEVLSRVR
jgi:uncharacterized membrane protein